MTLVPITTVRAVDCPVVSKHYIITGGAGFIGSHLSERLLGEGHRVTVLDDFSTGRKQNIRHLLASPAFSLVSDTVENAQTINLLVSQADQVFHLAAAVGVQLIVEQPVHTIRTCIRGTEVVLEACDRFGKPVLITSSSEVYGKGTRVPFSEDDDIVMGPTKHARWCYAYAKGIDEFLGLSYHKQYGLAAVVVRLFNTVGPRQVGMYGMVLPRFVEAAMSHRPLQVYGDGSQTRCFCHVSDVVEALIALTRTPSAVGQVFNVGGTDEISIRKLAERVIELAKSKSVIEQIPYEKAYGQTFDDLPRRVPSLERIKATIGFSPRYDLTQIISELIRSAAGG